MRISLGEINALGIEPSELEPPLGDGEAFVQQVEAGQHDEALAEVAAEIEPSKSLAEITEEVDAADALPTTVPQPVEIDADLWDSYMLAYERSKEWAQTLKERRAEIEQAMGDHEFATVAGRKRLRWYYRYPRKFQQARLKADHPDLIEAYTEDTAERRMELVEE